MLDLRKVFLLFFLANVAQCLSNETDLILDYKTAEELASLPLECYNKEFPYKSSIVFNSTQDVQVRPFLFKVSVWKKNYLRPF